MTMPEMEVLELRVLGPFEAVAGGRLVGLGGPRIRGVLARLAVVPGRTVSVAALVAELWGPRPPEDAYRTVRTYVSRLRAALRPAGPHELLVTRAPGYQLRTEQVAIDAVRFERAVAEGCRAPGPRVAAERLTQALELWRGEPFAEFSEVGEHPGLAAEAARLERLRLTAIEARAEAALQLGLDAQVAAELEELVRDHPTRERLWGGLMVALYRSGRQADALSAYRSARRVLVGEHGVEPSRALVEIHRRVLRQDPALDLDRSASAVRAGRVDG
ncbi:BTAD domain-containing putative transcriptional regulator [Actinomadura sp. NTSP31]|uniref:AfsR/SARP family transcriptional regulator n=1 Tax=Actinomadura sp. NTSP31 TaxID=1735447 RepID=UPI0035C0A883